ncbi:MAG TPA: antibiotic biosynthesis monooxygenase [Steroidobacteraceae bacterium]|nr:antibiotic biosynthesis monooxygenase [Steroidobacteraceae bacterium]
MFRIVWEFDAAPERVQEFERVYGSSGRWVDFFRRSDDYVSTELFRSLDSPTRFVTLDSWGTRAGYEAFRKAHADDYSQIDEECAQLTAHERILGMVDDGK